MQCNKQVYNTPVSPYPIRLPKSLSLCFARSVAKNGNITWTGENIVFILSITTSLWITKKRVHGGMEMEAAVCDPYLVVIFAERDCFARNTGQLRFRILLMLVLLLTFHKSVHSFIFLNFYFQKYINMSLKSQKKCGFLCSSFWRSCNSCNIVEFNGIYPVSVVLR